MEDYERRYEVALKEYKVKCTMYKRFLKTLNRYNMSDKEKLEKLKRSEEHSLDCTVYYREKAIFEREKYINHGGLGHNEIKRSIETKDKIVDADIEEKIKYHILLGMTQEAERLAKEYGIEEVAEDIKNRITEERERARKEAIAEAMRALDIPLQEGNNSEESI